MKLKLSNYWAVALIPVFVLVDQWSKWLVLSEPRFNAIACLETRQGCGHIPVPGPIDLTMVWNRGMSYGLLQSDGIGRWLLALVMLVIALGFLYWLVRYADHWLLKLSLGMVVGGAFGNLVDRVRFGAVVDFINAGDLYFPWIFNVADAAISVGAVLLFVDQFLLSGRKQAKKQS
ncbi:MAG: signal peptidase II [Hyphomonas sp.]|uniref:signal peptidase II n=1 Tax=Hyphomonas sp. TaxID=87 RepID=UPI0032630D36